MSEKIRRRKGAKSPSPAPKPARPRGRPAHEPTPTSRKQVELLAGFGNTADEIAMTIGVSLPTLRQYYSMELAAGRTKTTNSVLLNLFRQATKDDLRAVPAIQSYLRMVAGMSEYSPKPKDPAPGKKEQANLEAMTAEEGTEWADVLTRH